MAYCTQTDLLNLIAEDQLAGLTAETGETPDSDIVSDAITQADAEIDSYLGVRYSLPLSSTPEVIKNLSVDITIYNLYCRRDLCPDIRLKRYQAAIRWLENLAKGLVELNIDGVEVSAGAQTTMDVDCQDRVFSRELLEDY